MKPYDFAGSDRRARILSGGRLSEDDLAYLPADLADEIRRLQADRPRQEISPEMVERISEAVDLMEQAQRQARVKRGQPKNARRPAAPPPPPPTTFSPYRYNPQ